MITKVRVRVGTANSYRADDGNIGGRGDPLDCTHIFQPEPGEYRLGGHPDILNYITGGQMVEAPDPDQTIIFDAEASFIYHADCYLYCTSRAITKLMVKRMYDQFNCDACIKISDIGEFGEALGRACPKLGYSASRDVPDDTVLGYDVEYGPIKRGLPRRMLNPSQNRPEFRW